MKVYGDINSKYILILKEKNGKLSKEKIDLLLPYQVLDELDKIYHIGIKAYNVFDAQNYATNLNIEKYEKYAFCWPYQYNTPFVDETEYPQNRDKDTYYTRLNNIRGEIIEDYRKSFVKRNKGVYNDRLFNKYINDNINTIKTAIKNAQDNFETQELNDYIEKLRRYIIAQCYYKTIQSIKTTSLMYSNDVMGWYKPFYKIMDDAIISLNTNFCYGRSSYFFVNLKYRGINILPYDDLINYWWSNMMDNIRYTKEYFPYRENWDSAFDFVEEICNMIKTNPVEFEKKWIVEKIENMMQGLVTIDKDVESYYNQQIEFKNRRKDEQTINKYRCIDDKIIKSYKIYNHETLLVIQVDKLTAALNLLDDLMSIRIIYKSIINHIKTIVHYNKKLLPAIEKSCLDIDNRLKQLMPAKTFLESNIRKMEDVIKQFKDKVDRILTEKYPNKYKNSVERLEAVNNICSRKRGFIKVNGLLSDAKEKLNKVIEEVNDRESFKNHLTEKKIFILETLEKHNVL